MAGNMLKAELCIIMLFTDCIKDFLIDKYCAFQSKKEAQQQPKILKPRFPQPECTQPKQPQPNFPQPQFHQKKQLQQKLLQE